MTAICNHVGSDCGYSIRNGPHCNICAILSLQPARTYGGGWDHIRLRLRQWVIRKDSNERCMHRFRRGGEPSSCHSCMNRFPLEPSMEITLQVCPAHKNKHGLKPTVGSRFAHCMFSGHPKRDTGTKSAACAQKSRSKLGQRMPPGAPKEIYAASPQPAHKKRGGGAT